MNEQDMLTDLILESKEHLETIEPDLLEMEQKGQDVSSEIVNRIFRAVHSIKGGFGFFGKKPIIELSHAMENVMSRVRDGEATVTPPLVDALLRGVDKLRLMLDDVEGAEQIAYDEETELLAPFLEDNENNEEPEPTKSTKNDSLTDLRARHPKVTEEQLVDAVRNGRQVYQISLVPERELAGKDRTAKSLITEWEKFGQILDSKPSLSRLKQSKTSTKEISLVFTTILEPDLVPDALQVDSDAFLTVDLRTIRDQLREDAAPQPKKVSEGKKDVAAPAAKSEHQFEDALRVKVNLLNNLMNLAGELVLARNQLLQTMTQTFDTTPKSEALVRSIMTAANESCNRFASSSKTQDSSAESAHAELQALEQRIRALVRFPFSDIRALSSIVQNVDVVTTMLQESIMQTRLQPLAVVFNKFPRVIRDLARSLGKEISLEQVGQDVELDKSLIELLSDPLTHLIRNCADHGIEDPSIREEKGKPREGHVVLRAYQEGGKVIIEVTDDGAGINTTKVRQKAVERGVITTDQSESMSEREAQLLIFSPGFSTAQSVSNISGRGVGMDVVKTNIEKMGGTVEVESELGEGTTIILRLPLTLAIIPSLIVSAEDRRFAIPQVGLEEIVRIRSGDVTKKIERIGNAEVIRLRGNLLPLVQLAEVLQIPSTFTDPETGERTPDRRNRWSDRRKGEEATASPEVLEQRTGPNDRRTALSNAVKIAVLRAEKNRFGLVVDDVLDSEEIVVKPLPEYLKSSTCYAGTTIMGDGRVAMILDPNGISGLADLHFDEIEDRLQKEAEKKVEAARNEKLLLFSIGGPEVFGVNLNTIARIEKRGREEIETVGDKELVTYDESSLRLFHLDSFLPSLTRGDDGKAMYILVPKNASKPFGFVSTRVNDAIETSLQLETHSVKGPGIRGSALINNKMTVILDMESLLQQAEEAF